MIIINQGGYCSIELFFSDLTNEAREKLINEFGEFNEDFPLIIFEIEKED